MEQTTFYKSNNGAKQIPEQFPLEETQALRVSHHACKASQRVFLEANNRLRRANRDLGETAAFLAASLTTITAVEAVINLAVANLLLRDDVLQVAFDVYIVLLVVILVLGVLRFAVILNRRAKAEKEVDQAKQGVYRFCEVEQWPKSEE